MRIVRYCGKHSTKACAAVPHGSQHDDVMMMANARLARHKLAGDISTVTAASVMDGCMAVLLAVHMLMLPACQVMVRHDNRQQTRLGPVSRHHPTHVYSVSLLCAGSQNIHLQSHRTSSFRLLAYGLVGLCTYGNQHYLQG